jgi:DNA-binding MurR/RpiR family transcriptional regulator
MVDLLTSTQNVFLIGGFGESKYVQAELEQSLMFRDITLIRPDTSYAVA